MHVPSVVQVAPVHPPVQEQPQPSTWLPVTVPPLEQEVVQGALVPQVEPDHPPVQAQAQLLSTKLPETLPPLEQ